MYRVIGLKNSNYTKKYSFCEYVKFKAISWKVEILPTTAQLKFESENSLHYDTLITMILFLIKLNTGFL